jgi:hypothetical protein
MFNPVDERKYVPVNQSKDVKVHLNKFYNNEAMG